MQHEVVDRTGRPRRLDLAYPAQQVAVEYDGMVHEGRLAEDLKRYAALSPPWLLVRAGRAEVPARPEALVARTWEALVSRGADLPGAAPRFAWPS